MQLNESEDIHIDDCTNIDLSKMEEIHSRIVLYDTLVNTFETVNEIMRNVDSKPSHYCAWINDRILGKCGDENNTNYDHRDALNRLLCSRRTRRCDAQLCMLQSMQ